MADLVAAMTVLKSSLQKSQGLASQISKSGARIKETNHRLLSLETAIKSIGHKCSFLKIKGHIEHAVGPAAAVLKVFDVVNGLETLLLQDPCFDIFHYLSLVKQLEEALRLLTDNSGLVIRWLEDVLQFFEDNTDDDGDWYLLNVTKSMKILGELQAKGKQSRLRGGPLFIALEKLESEFRCILMENTFPMALSSTMDMEKSGISALPLSAPVIQKMQAIIERIDANNRIEKCVSIYVEVRSSNAQATMELLDLDYLDTSLSEFDSVQNIEYYIDQWGIHLEFAVKHVLELEYRLCSEVFQKVGSDIWTSCFTEIAFKSGIQSFIKFGNTITNGKKDAIKLLKLMDIFAALNKLRLDFNRVFGGKACFEIQTQTRDLIKKVVNGACEIFWELSVQVELQRGSTPPSDGSVPRLVSFVTEYCNQLLEDHYKLILIQILKIHMSWKNENFQEELLSNEVYKIIRAIELNLETWVKTYKDTMLPYLFMMNNHWYLSKNLKGTKLGDMMGDSWLKTHEQTTEHYAAIYLRESWGKLPSLLIEGGLESFSEAFDDIYKKQSNWPMSDKGLRGKICELVVEIIIPVYRSFMQNYIALVEQGTSPNKLVKYSAEGLENVISSLFQPKLGRYDSTKCTQSVDKIRNVMISHFSSTSAAA